MLYAGFEPAITIDQAAAELRLTARPPRSAGMILTLKDIGRPPCLASPLNVTRRLKMAGAILPYVIIEWYVVKDSYIVKYFTFIF
jgi:hypothetical protein